MPQSLTDLSETILALSTKERATLAHTLLLSLDERHDDKIEQAWEEEIIRRDSRLASGKTSERNAFQALDEARSKHS